MKKIYALLLLVSVSALSGCFHHYHDRDGRNNRGPQPQQQDPRGHLDDRGSPRR
ncbi:hypothetical protein GWD52_16320 [Enterobacteriaceae bacterium 4M9]|nr:hypothetical protein [Enterobacteriaceae bacterium 4M9]